MSGRKRTPDELEEIRHEMTRVAYRKLFDTEHTPLVDKSTCSDLINIEKVVEVLQEIKCRNDLQDKEIIKHRNELILEDICKKVKWINKSEYYVELETEGGVQGPDEMVQYHHREEPEGGYKTEYRFDFSIVLKDDTDTIFHYEGTIHQDTSWGSDKVYFENSDNNDYCQFADSQFTADEKHAVINILRAYLDEDAVAIMEEDGEFIRQH